jgi:hypothetical protein
LEIILLKQWEDGAYQYGFFFDANKVGATSCTLITPSYPGGVSCPFGLEPRDYSGVLGMGLSCAGLENEIETPGDDWTLVWDAGLPTPTIVEIDFGSIDCASDWPADFPTITNPPDEAVGVSADTSIDWTWPPSPVLYDLMGMLFQRPGGDRRDAAGLSHPPPPTSWTPAAPLAAGRWAAAVLNARDLRDVPDGLTITGTWSLDNTTWLTAGSVGSSAFTVGFEGPPVAVEEWSTTWSDPLLHGGGSPIVLSDDFEDGIIPLADTYSFMVGMPLLGDETGGELILQHPGVNPATGGLSEFLGWKVDEGNRAAPGPVVTSAVFTDGLVLDPGESYSVSIYSNDPALPLPIPPQLPPYQVVLVVYVFDGSVFAGLSDVSENNAPIAYRWLGSHDTFDPNSVELQLELVDDDSGWLLPEGRVCIDGGSCEPVDTTVGITPPVDLGAAPKHFQHGSFFGADYPEDATAVPSISFGGLALLAGLVFTVAVAGLAVQRRRRLY